MRKTIQLVPLFPSVPDQHEKPLGEWLTSAGDFADATMVSSAKHNGISYILSDDVDLATFAGITVLTANQRTIDAAKAAGKLII